MVGSSLTLMFPMSARDYLNKAVQKNSISNKMDGIILIKRKGLRMANFKMCNQCCACNFCEVLVM